MNRTIAESLGMDAVDQDMVLYEPKPAIDPTVEKDIADVRDNLFGLIDSGKRALDQLLDVADQSQHPRAYEVVSTLIKTLADVNGQVLDVYKKKNDLVAPIPTQQPGVVNQTAVFVGSTSELAKVIEDIRARNS